MKKLITIVVVTGLIVGLCLVVWQVFGQPIAVQENKPNAPKADQFDTTNGQEMKPRWNLQNGSQDGS